MKDLLFKLGARLKRDQKGAWFHARDSCGKGRSDCSISESSRSRTSEPFSCNSGKLAEALNVELSELFDLGHQGSAKEVRAKLRKLIQESSEEDLRLGLKLLHALS
jgi:hypothetical protein